MTAKPTKDVRELHLTMRLSNNRIRVRREELGRTRAEAAVAANLSYTTWCSLESLNHKPYVVRKKGDRTGRIEWSPSAVKLAESLNVTPDWLWPEAVLAVVQPKITTEIDAIDLRPMLVAAQIHPRLPSPEEDLATKEEQRFVLEEAFRRLTPMEERIVRARFGLDGESKSLDEIGEDYGLSRERVRQIECYGMAKIREAVRLFETERYIPKESMKIGNARPWWWCPMCRAWTRKVAPLPSWRSGSPDCFECGTTVMQRPPDGASPPAEEA